MGAAMNRRVCPPVQRVSPSFTGVTRAAVSASKNCPIIFFAAALHSMVISGYSRAMSAISAAWSGSMWWTTR